MIIILKPMVVAQVQFGSVTFSQYHFRSHKVTCVLIILTSYRNQIQQCEWSNCFQIVNSMHSEKY